MARGLAVNNEEDSMDFFARFQRVHRRLRREEGVHLWVHRFCWYATICLHFWLANERQMFQAAPS